MTIPSDGKGDGYGTGKVVIHKDAGLDVEQAIARTLGSCTSIYYELEECLAQNDRDWRKCQSVVKSLKLCNDSKAPKKSQ